MSSDDQSAKADKRPPGVARYGRPLANFDGQDKNSPLQAYGVLTRFALDDVLDPEIDDAVRFAASHDPGYYEGLRYRLYLNCKFAETTVAIPGDLLFAGVSFGKSTHAVLKYLGSRLGLKKTWLIDKWEGRIGAHDRR